MVCNHTDVWKLRLDNECFTGIPFLTTELWLRRGKFGTVYRCEEKKTGRILAAKFILTQRAEDRADVEREVEIMRSLQHPRLLAAVRCLRRLQKTDDPHPRIG
ncbi:hypothetical protein HPB51_002045 [Rhipicephalus microplus]|uniref:Protein kinase domain-containing protein n=1 Tax=Rhipicephalus microplus TaxID=6941 RepID=A0A9J6DRZ2_RHIMP|nr:hypothetical protein HPB51_002045 [Rhipicephalus microplus]